MAAYMTSECELFLQELDQQIQSKHLLKHDFYQAWSKGELTVDCLQEYAKEYYHHVKAFPTYISAIHARCDDQSIRSILLKNIIEEEAGSPNHPELWKNFALSLGVNEEELVSHKPNNDIEKLIHTFRQICSQNCLANGVAALYTYESQIPEICVSKIAGLKEHYGMNDSAAWHYFTVHIQADIEHAAEERALLQRLVSSQEVQEIKRSVNAILDVLWNFLSGLCQRYHIECAT